MHIFFFFFCLILSQSGTLSTCVLDLLLPKQTLFDIPFETLLSDSSTFWNTTFGIKPSFVPKVVSVDELFTLDHVFTYLTNQQIVGDDNQPDGFVSHGKGWRLIKRAFRDGEWWSSSPRNGPIHMSIIDQLFRNKGYTFVIDRVQEYHPPLKGITSALENLFGHRVNANVYVTPNENNYQGFESHFDYMDGLILQVIGCKLWRLARKRSIMFPIADTVFRVNHTLMEDAQHIELHPGSLLYIPRGYAHEAAMNCSNQHIVTSSSGTVSSANDKKVPVSLHITFGLEVGADSTMEVFVHHLVNQLQISDDIHDEMTCNHLNQNDQDSTGFNNDNNTSCSNNNNDTRILIPSIAHTIKLLGTREYEGHSLILEGLDTRDWLHLLLHVVACMDDGIPLRKAIATTTFTAKTFGYPLLTDQLSELKTYLMSSTSLLWTPTINDHVMQGMLRIMEPHLHEDTVGPTKTTYIKEFLSSHALKTIAKVLTHSMIGHAWQPSDQQFSIQLQEAWMRLIIIIDNDENNIICRAWSHMIDKLGRRREERMI